MDVSRTLARTLSETFDGNTECINHPGNPYLVPDLRLDKGNIYNREIIVDLSKESIEYPVFIKKQVERAVTDNCLHLEEQAKDGYTSGKFVNTIICPLYCNSNVDISKRTFDSSIKKFFKDVGIDTRLLRISIGDEIYYGTAGLLLDRDFNILLLCTLTAHRVQNAAPDGNPVYNWEYDKPICYVSPMITLDPKKNLIYRGIYNKVIPYYSNGFTTMPYGHGKFRRNIKDGHIVTVQTVRVIVDSVQHWIHTPTKPDINTYKDENLNKCALEHLEEIEDCLVSY